MGTKTTTRVAAVGLPEPEESSQEEGGTALLSLDRESLFRLLERDEQCALLAKSVHDQLVLQGDKVLAPILWVIHRNAARNAEQLGELADEEV
jgi:hypothetical protein